MHPVLPWYLASVGASEERQPFIEQETIDHLIRSLICEDLKIIVALARYGGCRTHETLIHRWEDVDWVKGTILIRSTKNPPVRVVPLFPELRCHLMRAKEMASKGATLIQNRYRPGLNPGTNLTKKIIEAGITPLPKLIQNLRASRETELLAKYPAKDATAWIGNSIAVANKHYAMTLKPSFEQAVAEGASPTPHKAPQTVQDQGRQDKKGDPPTLGEIAIDSGKDGIRLDLSSLVPSLGNDENYPARTRTLND